MKSFRLASKRNRQKVVGDILKRRICISCVYRFMVLVEVDCPKLKPGFKKKNNKYYGYCRNYKRVIEKGVKHLKRLPKD